MESCPQKPTSLEHAFKTNNKLQETLINTISPDIPSTNSFRTDVQTHDSLLLQISNSSKENFSEVLIGTKDLDIDDEGTLFKVTTGNLDASDVEYFTSSINKLNQGQLEVENLLKN